MAASDEDDYDILADNLLLFLLALCCALLVTFTPEKALGLFTRDLGPTWSVSSPQGSQPSTGQDADIFTCQLGLQFRQLIARRLTPCFFATL